MKMPTEKQMSDAETTIGEIFESIKKHEGEKMSDFVHALVSSKQVSDGVHLLCHLASKDIDDEKAIKFINTVEEKIQLVLHMAVSYFYKSGGQSFDIEKAMDWAQVIDGQMDSFVARVREGK